LQWSHSGKRLWSRAQREGKVFKPCASEPTTCSRQLLVTGEPDVAKRSDVRPFRHSLFIDSGVGWMPWYLRPVILPDTCNRDPGGLKPPPAEAFCRRIPGTGRLTTCDFGLLPTQPSPLRSRKLAGQDFVGERESFTVRKSAGERNLTRTLGDAWRDGALFTREDAVEAAWIVC